jgi:cell division septal protein FtsQ
MPTYRDFAQTVASPSRSTRRRTQSPAPALGRRSQARLGRTRQHSATAEGISPSLGALPRPLRRRRLMSVAWFSAVALVGLLAALIYVFVSPDWYVWDVDVAGAQWLSHEEIVEVAGVTGTSIFYVQPAKIVEALSALPTVERARVTCWLPNRVSIYLVERQPAAIWQSQNTQYWVDKDGILFPRAADLNAPVVIVEQSDAARQPGDRVDAEALATALQIREHLPAARIFGYSATEGLSFDVPEGQRVLAPVQADAARKVASLRAVQEYLKAESIEYKVIDLRYAGRAFWR